MGLYTLHDFLEITIKHSRLKVPKLSLGKIIRKALHWSLVILNIGMYDVQKQLHYDKDKEDPSECAIDN